MENSVTLDDEQSLTRRLFEISPDCLKLLDMDGCVLHINKNGQAALGLDEISTVQNQEWATFWPPHKRDKVHAALAKARSGETARLIESCPTFKGQEKYWDVIITRVGGAAGTPRRLIVASRDITDNKKAEHDLRASEAKLRLGLDIAGIGIGAMDYGADTNTLDAKGAELFDLEANVALPRSDIHARFHPEDLAMINAAMAASLDPAGSGFMSIEHRVILADGRVRWISARKHIFFAQNQTGVLAPSHGLLAIRDISERKGALARINDLMNEVNHRSKNLLSVVQAIARQTSRGGTPATFLDRLTSRITGLAASQDLMIQNSWRGVGLSELVAAQLTHFSDTVGDRIIIEGPQLNVSASAAQAIGMAMFELGTNAAKYGALSNDTGSVRISWTVDPNSDSGFTMAWDERNGPRVEPPAREGFGRLVIVTMIEGALSGKVRLDYQPAGVQWRYTGPLQRVKAND